MPGDELRHRQHVARLRPAALQVAVLQVRRRDLQRLADPLAGREAAPAVRRPGRRMRAAVDEDRPVERAHELHAVADDLAGDRIEVLQDARAADAAPLVRRRVRPALVFGRAPDRFRRRVGAQAAGLVEREAEVVGQRRLPGILGVVEPPFAGDVRRPRLGGRADVMDRGRASRGGDRVARRMLRRGNGAAEARLHGGRRRRRTERRSMRRAAVEQSTVDCRRRRRHHVKAVRSHVRHCGGLPRRSLTATC